MAGTLATMLVWNIKFKPSGLAPPMLAAFGASMFVRMAKSRAFDKAGHPVLAEDVIAELSPAMDVMMADDHTLDALSIAVVDNVSKALTIPKRGRMPLAV